jgi:hypothetical protein
MHTFKRIALVAVLALFTIVGVVSISKAEISEKAIICDAKPFDLFYEFGEEEITHHSLSMSNDENNTQFEYKVFTTDMSYRDFNKTAQWLEDYSEFKSRVFYLELENMTLSVGGRGAYQCELLLSDAFKLRLDEYVQSIKNKL